MTLLSATLTSLIFSGFATILACGPTSSAVKTMTQNTKMAKASPAYSKPGASIYMTSDYDGMSVPGKPDTANFSLSHSYPGAILTVSVIAPDQIELITAPQGEQRILTGGVDEVYDLVFAARGQSITPISILAELERADGQYMRRSFSIMVNSTGEALEKTVSGYKKPAAPQVRREKGTTVMSMPMQEEIIKN